MSAFVVSDAVINQIVSYFNRQVASNEHSPIKGVLHDAGILVEEAKDCADLARKMQALNAAAVAYRYPAQPVQLGYSFKFDDRCTNLIALYRLIRCWLYQCTEGEQFETSPVYKHMETMRTELATHIVEHLPEYNDCLVWGEAA